MRGAHLLTPWFKVLLMAAVAIVGAAGAFSACDSLASFTGVWQGPVSSDPNLHQGFSSQDALTLNIAALNNGTLDMTVNVPGQPQGLRFEPVRRASADALGSLSLPGDPLRSYLGYLQPPGQAALLMVVSLFPPDHVEARVIRGPDEVYGVFRLSKR